MSLVGKAARAVRRLRNGSVDAWESFWLSMHRAERDAIIADAARCSTAGDWYGLAAAYFGMGSIQIQEEIVAFLDMAASRSPRFVCEIGTEYGGTNLLLLRALPSVTHVIGIDLWVRNKAKLRLLAHDGQRLDYITGASQNPARRDRVARLLDGQPLDLLLIDGDHSFEGVRTDFLLYRHLVREGGIVAFHDIVPDGSERGLDTGAYAGGVPRFWRLMKKLYPAQEFVRDWDQQFGLGIGAITYSSDVKVGLKELSDEF